MKLKKLLQSFFLCVSSFLLSAEVFAENGENAIDKTKFADVLLSFLYFAGVLVLIYIILVLVNKWGKKHPDKKKEENTAEETERQQDKISDGTENQEKNAENEENAGEEK